MLNYAYAVLYAQVKMEINAEGRDPTIGLAHSTEKYRDALVLDRMEPMRPVVDGAILRLITSDTLHAGDFTITNEGVCRLNPQLARKVVAVTSAGIKDSARSATTGLRIEKP
jgi:CRISP-associated protein Cas1